MLPCVPVQVPLSASMLPGDREGGDEDRDEGQGRGRGQASHTSTALTSPSKEPSSASSSFWTTFDDSYMKPFFGGAEPVSSVTHLTSLLHI